MRIKNKIIPAILITFVIAVLFSPIILSWYWHYYWEVDSKTQSLLPAPPACYVPSDAAVDGVSTAIATSWDDLNGNGIKDGTEPVLSHVVVMMTDTSYSYNPNDPPISWNKVIDLQYDEYEWLKVIGEDGTVNLSQFKPGCPCNCWKGNAVAAWVPQGYKFTTPSLVELNGYNQTISFGFQKIGP